MNERTEGRKGKKRKNRRTQERTDGRTKERMNERMDKRSHERTKAEGTDGRMNELTCVAGGIVRTKAKVKFWRQNRDRANNDANYTGYEQASERKNDRTNQRKNQRKRQANEQMYHIVVLLS